MNTFVDYYAILGVPTDAPPGAIKAAFKKLALQYHPDVYKGDDAHERMRELLAAYQTLNDPEERKRYDTQRSGHWRDGVYTPGSAQGVRQKRAEVSPSARRDRLRYYGFPDLRDALPGQVDLFDIAYTLSPEQVPTLRYQGLLRGEAPKSEQGTFYCHRCRHHWPTSSSQQSTKEDVPFTCPRCHATDWSEYLLLRCTHCRAVFESEQIRYEVGTYNYGKVARASAAALCPPYELFPLCPYCSAAHWCPAEEERVSKLRARAARQAATMRVALIGVAIVLIVIMGTFLLAGVR